MHHRNAYVALLLLSGLILVSSLSVGFYQISGGGNGSNFSYTFYGFRVGVQGPNLSDPMLYEPYSAEHLGSVGGLYEWLMVDIAVGTVLIAIACFLCLGRPGVQRARLLLAVTLGVLALLVVAPLLLAVGQPIAACNDIRGFGAPVGVAVSAPETSVAQCTGWEFYTAQGWYSTGQPSGPGTSFQGHSAQHGGFLTWGPSLGWFLLVVSAILASGAVGLAISNLARARQPIPTVAPAVT